MITQMILPAAGQQAPRKPVLGQGNAPDLSLPGVLGQARIQRALQIS